jgi:hypothetical protein
LTRCTSDSMSCGVDKHAGVINNMQDG